jgi:type II secretory pathway component GspD/PulD (secretin)
MPVRPNKLQSSKWLKATLGDCAQLADGSLFCSHVSHFGYVVLLGCLLGFGCAMLSGCAGLRSTPRPTIESLFSQAMNDSADHPENSYLQPERASQLAANTDRNDVLPEEIAPSKAKPQKLLNELFQDTDIREAVQILAQDAGVNVIMDEKVKGVVNTTIENLPFDEALPRLLLPIGLVSAYRDGQYYIGTAEPDSPLFYLLAEHHEFRPNHHSTQEIVSVLPERMKRYVRIVEKANVIAVDAPRIQAQAIIDRFVSIDQPVPQVILETIVCVMSPDCNFRFGLDWNHAVPINGQDAFSLGIESLGISGKYTKAGARDVAGDFARTSAFVQLMAENGYLAIRASPRVMAKDGEKANISLNRETWFSPQGVTSTQTAQSNNVVFPQSIQKVDSGIVLSITPHIRGDTVDVNIDRAEVSEDIRASGVDSTNPYPVISRRFVSTTVHVQDSKTIVIGGLVQRQMVEHISRIPGLSNLPLVGGLFQTVQRQEKDVEVVIFLSPRIVTSAAPMDRVAERPDQLRANP